MAKKKVNIKSVLRGDSDACPTQPRKRKPRTTSEFERDVFIAKDRLTKRIKKQYGDKITGEEAQAKAIAAISGVLRRGVVGK